MLRSFYPILLSAPLLFSMACSTLPKDAPAELKEARDAIKTAEKKDVDATFPKTIKRAQNDYDSARKHFKESKEGKGSAEAKREQSIQEARSATKLATGATDLNARIRGWDGDFNSYLAEQDRIRDLEQTAANARKSTTEVVEVPTVGNFQLRGAVAFFDTNRAKLRRRDQADVRSISAALKENPNLQVRIMGYADPRGNSAHNKRLSTARAHAVADMLANAGIPRDRMIVVGEGEVRGRARMHRPDLLQLDRRVDAVIISSEAPVAH